MHRGFVELWPALLGVLLSALIVLADVNRASFFVLNTEAQRLPQAFWALCSRLGDTSVAAVLTALCLRRWRDLWAVLLVSLIASGLTHTFKPLFDIGRPALILLDQPFHIIGKTLYWHSFPSGHAATAFTIAGYLILRGGPAWRWAVLPLALLVALSRVAVGAHWPLDIAFGAAVGWFGAWAGLRLSECWTWRRHPRSIEIAIGLMLLNYAWLRARPFLGYADDRLIEAVLASACLLIVVWQWWRDRSLRPVAPADDSAS